MRIEPVEKSDSTSTGGSVFQGLGTRLRRVLGRTLPGEDGDVVGVDPPTGAGAVSEEVESALSRATFIASGAESKAHSSTDYRYSAIRIQSDLTSAKSRLKRALEAYEAKTAITPLSREKVTKARYILAQIYTTLGDYWLAKQVYTGLCPWLSSSATMVEQTMQADLSACEDYEIEMLAGFLKFLVKTGKNLELAEALGYRLLETIPLHRLPGTTHWKVLFLLARLHNTNLEPSRALKCVEEVESSPNWTSYPYMDAETTISLSLARASTWANLGKDSESTEMFRVAIVSSAVLFGLWNPVTLGVLHDYGTILMERGNDKAAAIMLSECCLAGIHRLGKSHPAFLSAYSKLEPHLTSSTCFDLLHGVNKDASDNSTLSLAYEHGYINTVVELLLSVGETRFDMVEDILQRCLYDKNLQKVESSEHRAVRTLRIHRALARCKFEQGEVAEAISLIEELGQSREQRVVRSTEGEFQSKLDLAIFYDAGGDTQEKALELRRSLFFDVDVSLNSSRAEAFHRKLAQLGYTHFPYSATVNDPLPIRVLENVGTGAYAVVESVEIGGKTYARKSIALPRYNQNRIRQTIQNEISVIRSLSHPHIVRVHFTYEEKTRFAIVLQPLASCDLEAFLENPTKEASSSVYDYSILLWKWFGCLASTVAFIHSKGIRHKDIKARNILIKDTEVFFADFGSSHAFLDEGNSVTEGPAFGHTLMYCAPEVVSFDKRSRSADIFSLGCVFTEMATLLDGRQVSDYHEFRSITFEASGSGGETHAYHATLNRVDDWFGTAQPRVDSFYTCVVKPMLSREPEARPTASQAYSMIQPHLKNIPGDETEETCSRCNLER